MNIFMSIRVCVKYLEIKETIMAEMTCCDLASR